MLTPLDEALAAIRRRARPLPAEDVPLAEADGRVLAEAVRARRDQPETDISMMDGYALRAADVAGPLRLAGEIAAGDAPWTRSLAPGEAARIFTGAPLPPGADCVVMQEHSVREGSTVRVQQPPKAGQHIRRRGEELLAGAEALPAGRVLDPSDLARAAGAEVLRLGVAPDAVERIAERLRDAPADILLTTGGASVGDHDHAQDALERLGGELIFHTVAIRPGRPVLFGTASADRLVFGLPGNPAAATLGFELFVRLAVRMLSGDPKPDRPAARARLRGSITRVEGLTYFPRGAVRAEGSTLVFTPGEQQSSMQIASWSGANAVAMIPPGEGKLEEGSEIDILLVGPLT